MKTITPTALRKELFGCVDGALHGRSVRVAARQGNVILISEKQYLRGREKCLSARIDGRIVGELADADQALREHVTWPRA